MFELRDYQKKAIDEIKSSLQRGSKKVIHHAPTGSGKTDQGGPF